MGGRVGLAPPYLQAGTCHTRTRKLATAMQPMGGTFALLVWKMTGLISRNYMTESYYGMTIRNYIMELYCEIIVLDIVEL